MVAGHALPGGLYALRRGPLARAIFAFGLSVLLASYTLPLVAGFRLPSHAGRTALPALTVPAYSFPKLRPPAAASTARRAPQRPFSLAAPSTPAPRANRALRMWGGHPPLRATTARSRVPVVTTKYDLLPA